MHRTTRLVGFLLATALAFSALTPAPAVASRDEIAARLEGILHEYRKHAEARGITARVVKPGVIDWSTAMGHRDPEAGAAMTRTDSLRAGSVTKQMVAVVVLQLVEEGVLSLDDTLGTWFPDYPSAERITIRQLLRHRSGIPEVQLQDLLFILLVVFDQYRWWNPEDVVAWTHAPIPMLSFRTGRWEKRGPVFPPGEGFHYSQPGYFFLGMIVERVTGNRLADELDARVYDPLGMDSTFLPVPETQLDIVGWSNLFGLFPFRIRTDIVLMSERSYSSSSWAAGGVLSTADDLSTFLQALLGGRLLRPETLDLMRETLPTGNPFDPPSDDPPRSEWRYGMGFSESIGPEYTIWGHGGGVPGFHAVNDYVVQCDLYISLTANSDFPVGSSDPDAVPFDLRGHIIDTVGC